MTASGLPALVLVLASGCQTDDEATEHGSKDPGPARYDVVNGWPVLPESRILGHAWGMRVQKFVAR